MASGEVLGDVDLIWSNCRSFNEADFEICDLADQAQQALRLRWQQEGLPTVTPLPPSARKKQKKDGKKPMLAAGDSCDNALASSNHFRRGVFNFVQQLLATLGKRVALQDERVFVICVI